jgi:hypothetical protein
MVTLDATAPGWAHELVRRLNAALDVLRGGQMPVHSVTKLPKATPAGRQIYVADEAGGAVPAFSDGAVWRRVTDRTVVS